MQNLEIVGTDLKSLERVTGHLTRGKVALAGAVSGLVWSQIGFAAATRRGTRDFSSISQIVATRYEVLVEHRLADQARGVLAGLPSK